MSRDHIITSTIALSSCERRERQSAFGSTQAASDQSAPARPPASLADDGQTAFALIPARNHPHPCHHRPGPGPEGHATVRPRRSTPGKIDTRFPASRFTTSRSPALWVSCSLSGRVVVDATARKRLPPSVSSC